MILFKQPGVIQLLKIIILFTGFSKHRKPLKLKHVNNVTFLHNYVTLINPHYNSFKLFKNYLIYGKQEK